MRSLSKLSYLLVAIALLGCQGEPKREATGPDPLTPWEVRLDRSEARLAISESFSRRCEAMDLTIELARRRPDREERLAAAERGLGHARRAVLLRPDHPAGHYALGVLTGLRMKNQLLPSLGGVQEIRDHFLKAASCDESYRHGAPYRALGQLFAQAPPWPTSIGDPDEAIHYLNESLRVAPEWPETYLSLAAVLLDEGADLAQIREKLDQAATRLEQPKLQWSQVEAYEWQAELERLRARSSGKT